MKQKFTKYLIAMTMMLMPMLASAQTATQGLAYTIDATLGGAVITGPGSFNCVGPLVIPNSLGGQPVVAIGASAFNSKTGITTLDLSLATSLVRIGKMAFNMCKLTGDLDLSALTKLEVIDRDAFYSHDSNAFRDGQFTGMLTLPEGGALRIIGRGVFQYTGFVNDNIVIPATVTDIGTKSLCACPNIRSVTFKSTGTINLGDSIFYSGFEMLSPKLEYVDMSTCILGKAITTNGTLLGNITNLSRMNSNNPPDGQPFLGTPAHTMIYLPKDNATGDLAAAMTKLVDGTDNMNYVRLDQTGNNQCAWFYVQDGVDYYIPQTFSAAKATWNAAGNGAELTANPTRTNFSKLVTAYLPFDFTLPASSGLQGFTMLDKKNDPEHVFRFKQQAATVTFNANTPYILRNASGAAIAFPEATGTINVPKTPVSRILYAADGVTTSYDGGVSAVDNTAGGTISDPVKGTWGFYGTTEAVSNNNATAWKALILSGGAWYDLNSDVNSPLSPLRAFLATSDGAAGAKPSFTLEDLNGNLIGGTNGIDEIDNNEPTNSVETRIYNLNGQYLGKDINTLPKGLYIVNGKKTIKK